MMSIIFILFCFFEILFAKKFRLRFVAYKDLGGVDQVFLNLPGTDIFEKHFVENNFEILNSDNENSPRFNKSNNWDL